MNVNDDSITIPLLTLLIKVPSELFDWLNAVSSSCHRGEKGEASSRENAIIRPQSVLHSHIF